MTSTGPRLAQPLQPGAAEDLRFRRQWAILDSGASTPTEAWSRLALGHGRELVAHPELALRTKGDARAGIALLGLLVDGRSGSDPAPTLEALDPADGDAIAAALHPIGGTYVLVAWSAQAIRLYTDPAAMMGVFHAAGRAASSPRLLPGLVRDEAVDRAFPFRGTDDWYPGSLTPYVGVRALLANHELDLSSGASRRFWPTQPAARLESGEGIARSAELLRGMLAGIVRARPALVSITGGRDSRVVLAALRERVDQAEYFTLRSPDIKRCDLAAPELLAERCGIEHHFIDVTPSEPWVVELYDEIAADMSIGTRREILGACARLAGPYVHVNGNLGAITKSYFWHSPRPKHVKPRSLAKEFVRRPPCIMDALAGWHASVPAGLPATTVYNLMYLEQRGGRWMGIGETAANLFYESVTPFSNRLIFEAVCGMPDRTQYGGTLLVDLVRHMWPELLEVPYCPVTRNWGAFVPKRLKASLKRVLGRP